MPDSNKQNAADYYLNQYRKVIRFANIALGAALAILVVNWLLAVEPGFNSLKHDRHLYHNQIKDAQKSLVSYNHGYSRYLNRYLADSQKNGKNLIIKDILEKRLKTKKALTDSLAQINDLIEDFNAARITNDDYKKNILLFSDSIRHLQGKRRQLDSLKSISLNENIKEYNWGSIIRFVFLVAAEPKSGSLYLMVLISSILVFGFVCRILSLRFLAKAIRIYKLQGEGINSHYDLAINVPFWLSPTPVRQKEASKHTESLATKVDTEELMHIMGLSHMKSAYTIWLLLCLIGLFALQLRLFYICLFSNPPSRFDFNFTIGVILCVISFSQSILWLLQIKIDDHLNNEKPINHIDRRLFISITLSALISILIIGNKNNISSYLKLNAKRFFRKKKKVAIKKLTKPLSPGLYSRREKSGYILYFFGEEKYSIVLKNIANQRDLEVFENRLKLTTAKDIIGNRNYEFCYSNRSWHIENFTLHLIKEKKIADAQAFILDQLTSGYQHSRDYRLLDLAEKIFIKYANQANMERLMKHYSEMIYRDRQDEDDYDGFYRDMQYKELETRIRKWSNINWGKINKEKYAKWNNIKI